MEGSIATLMEVALMSPKEDIFALGVVLHELIKGHKVGRREDITKQGGAMDTLQFLEDNKSNPAKLKSKLKEFIYPVIKKTMP
ncbi:unnamed protein product [Prunus armeniaca]|uniref:Uncharacterized protein n=1 Tax=Prunus armeniaca TaxID=36596 RepID=A0A6J5VQM0_PRUAR|nr:unnamed protein product [Prunus armeniaca]